MLVQVGNLVADATDGEWTKQPWAQRHALEASPLFQQYVIDAVPDAVAAADGTSDGAGPSDPAAAEAPAALTAEMVADEVVALFEQAKGLSLSVLQATRVQARRGAMGIDKFPHHGGGSGSDSD